MVTGASEQQFARRLVMIKKGAVRRRKHATTVARHKTAARRRVRTTGKEEAGKNYLLEAHPELEG
jgi:hypothetical protein